MSNITKDQILSLVKIQKIEIETRSINKNLSSVDQRLAKLDDSLLEFKQAIDQQQTVVNQLNQQYRGYESDVRANLDRIKKSEAKLRSVKTNKEYQASLKEIDDLKEKNSKFEDDMIEFLDRIEAAEKALKAKMAEYSGLQTRVNAEKEIIQKETEEGRRKLEDLEAQWKTASAGIDTGLFATYNQVKSNHGNGIGIVAVIDAVCQGCNMNIPAQIYNELQRADSLKKCPICERIIYWQKKDKRSE